MSKFFEMNTLFPALETAFITIGTPLVGYLWQHTVTVRSAFMISAPYAIVAAAVDRNMHEKIDSEKPTKLKYFGCYCFSTGCGMVASYLTHSFVYPIKVISPEGFLVITAVLSGLRALIYFTSYPKSGTQNPKPATQNP